MTTRRARPLGAKQIAILEAIHAARAGIASPADVTAATGVSLEKAWHSLASLERRGLVARERRQRVYAGGPGLRCDDRWALTIAGLMIVDPEEGSLRAIRMRIADELRAADELRRQRERLAIERVRAMVASKGVGRPQVAGSP